MNMEALNGNSLALFSHYLCLSQSHVSYKVMFDDFSSFSGTSCFPLKFLKLSPITTIVSPYSYYSFHNIHEVSITHSVNVLEQN
jgi:hypothetical protein